MILFKVIRVPQDIKYSALEQKDMLKNVFLMWIW